VPIDIADWTDSVQANISPSVQATVLTTAGSSVVLLPDTGIFSVGDTVKVTSGLTAAPAADPTTALIQAINPDVSVTLSVGLLNDCKIGDVVQRQNSIDVYDRVGRQLGIASLFKRADGTGPTGISAMRTWDVNVVVPAGGAGFVAIPNTLRTGAAGIGRLNCVFLAGFWLSFFTAPGAGSALGLSLVDNLLVEQLRLWNFAYQSTAGYVMQAEFSTSYFLGNMAVASAVAQLGLAFLGAGAAATTVFGKIFGLHVLTVPPS
jgi:hypothetical protein